MKTPRVPLENHPTVALVMRTADRLLEEGSHLVKKLEAVRNADPIMLNDAIERATVEHGIYGKDIDLDVLVIVIGDDLVRNAR